MTGKIKGDIIDGERKAEIFKEIAKIQNLSLDQVIAVGDGANDLPMLNIAGPVSYTHLTLPTSYAV